MNPLVSVIVATYRRDNTLWNSLLSLTTQTYSPIEIVLVDDNGVSEWNNKVNEIVDRFKSSFPNVSFLHITNAKNQGSANTRNIGIKASNGEYVTFLDDDDLYLPSKIERQVSFMETEGLDYSVTDLELYNENDKLIDKRTRTYLSQTNEQSLFECHLKYHITGTDTMMFRKDYITAFGGFLPIDVGDEFYLMQRSIEQGGKFGYLPVCDIKAYVHTGEGGLSSGQGKIDGENFLYNYKKQYFETLSRKTVKYIKARHFAVLSYAYLRMKSYANFLKNSMRGFLCAPIMFCGILLNR